jgi:hypothetical protein
MGDGPGPDPPATEESHASVSLAGTGGGWRLEVITDIVLIHRCRPS